MPAQFDDLPYELRHEIFCLAFRANFRPRTIEIFFKDGEIYSKTRPPPLLQVCQLSRYVVLRHYKPWLPMFKGRKSHLPWEYLVEGKGLENLSRLHNVCIDLKRDTLFINTQQWSKWNFGLLERLYLRQLIISVAGWQQWITIPDLAARFKKLEFLILSDDTTTSKLLKFKQGVIRDRIRKKRQGKVKPGDTCPKIRCHNTSSGRPWNIIRRGEWITYKHPKASKTTLIPLGTTKEKGHAPAQKSTAKSQGVRQYKYSLPAEYKNRSRSLDSAARVTSRRKVNKDRREKNSDVSSLSSQPPKLSDEQPSTHQPRKFLVARHGTGKLSPKAISSTRSSQEFFASLQEGLELARSPSPDSRSFNKAHRHIVVNEAPMHSTISHSAESRLRPLSPLRKFVNPLEDLNDLEMAFLFSEPPRKISPVLTSTASVSMSGIEDFDLVTSSAPARLESSRRATSADYLGQQRDSSEDEDTDYRGVSNTQQSNTSSSTSLADTNEDAQDIEMSDSTQSSCDGSDSGSQNNTALKPDYQHGDSFMFLPDDSDDDVEMTDSVTSSSLDESPTSNGRPHSADSEAEESNPLGMDFKYDDSFMFLADDHEESLSLEPMHSTASHVEIPLPHPETQANNSFESDATPNSSFISPDDISMFPNPSPTTIEYEPEEISKSFIDIDDNAMFQDTISSSQQENLPSYQSPQSKKTNTTTTLPNEQQEEFPNSQSLLTIEENTPLPHKIMAERTTSFGPQYLIQWLSHPSEKDWTWESQNSILQSAPDLVMNLLMDSIHCEPEHDTNLKSELKPKPTTKPKTNSKTNTLKEEEKENTVPVETYIPSKILSKKKFKGIPHYLVQWEGYPKIEDRTWEPCERLAVDVPLMVEGFEERRVYKKKKGVKVKREKG